MLAAVDIGNSLQKGLDSIVSFLPNLIGFLVILLVGWIIARIARAAVNKLLEATKVDRALSESAAGPTVERLSPGSRPSHLIGALVYWFIFLFAIAAAVDALKISALSNFIAQIQAYLPNVIAAVLIFVIAAVVAGAAGGLVHRTMGDTPTGRVVRAVVPGLVLAIGLFMVLNQLRIAPEIVTITYTALIGMLALAGALAFGLGGREVAGQMLSDALEAGKNQGDQVKQDLRTGRERAQSDAERLRDKADEHRR